MKGQDPAAGRGDGARRSTSPARSDSVPKLLSVVKHEHACWAASRKRQTLPPDENKLSQQLCCLAACVL